MKMYLYVDQNLPISSDRFDRWFRSSLKTTRQKISSINLSFVLLQAFECLRYAYARYKYIVYRFIRWNTRGCIVLIYMCVCMRAHMDGVKDWRSTCTCIAIYGFAPTGSVSHSFYEHIRQRMSRNQCGLRVMHSLPLGDINRPRDQLPFSMEEVTVASAVVVCRSPTGDRLLNDAVDAGSL